ncbi:hypothetical protein V501_05918 [Pseudogymnoascus sp. VKM F-4519 (FW-2642)]|nr:hypothetical protein V501_05918 [Pseudogymnoascus sp. VKM F-4519 (FW-2642)]
MNWEPQTQSFGDPNAQTPTPQQTPTSAAFRESALGTPQGNINAFDTRSGWTPTFAEDYTVFNATPGRLTNTQSTFEPFSLGNPTLGSSAHEGVFENSDTKTPNRPNQRLREPLSGQTATPPRSTAKDLKKERRRLEKSNMQHDEESFLQSGIMGQDDFLDFTQSSGDMFSYPMTAPVPVPAYLNDDKSFWDPDSSMADVSMDFMAEESSFYGTTQQVGSSEDWPQSHQASQDSLGTVPLQQHGSQPLRRHRPLMAKPPAASSAAQSLSNTAFDFSISSMPQDPFGGDISSGVNPGLIFSYPEATSPLHVNQSNIRPVPQRSRSAAGLTMQEPYEHQYRESLRGKPEPRRSRSLKENIPDLSHGGARFGSPVEGNRPGPPRSSSDSRPKKRVTSHENQPPPNFAGKGVYSSGRQSPTKQASRMNLASIPEAAGLNPRTAVTFSIDANGRARTETTIVVDDSRSSRRINSRASSDGWESPQSGSSTDEDPIMIPSRNASFSIPNKRGMPKMAHFDTSRQSRSRKSGSANSSSHGDPDSDSETVIDGGKSGDAASALRKAMGSRRRSVSNMTSTQLHATSRASTRQVLGSQGHYQRQSYAYQPSSSNASPTTISDPDGETPSTDLGSAGSDSTRCVCSSRDGDEYMIQCESCEKWLHCNCVNVHPQRLPKVYICAFCVQTPNMRGPRVRGAVRASTKSAASPLAHKSFESWR